MSFHRLPLNDPVLLKKWLIKIRQQNTPVNHNSRVCSAHFEGGKRSSDSYIPTIFPWSKSSRKPPKKRSSPKRKPPPKRRRTDQEIVANKENIFQSVSASNVSSLCSPVRSIATTTNASSGPVRIAHVATANASTNTVQNVFNAATQTHASCSDAVTQTNVLKADVEIQHSPTMLHKSIQTELKVSDASTSTEDLDLEPVPFSIEQIKNNDTDVTFYTGFASFLHFLACFNFLGPAVTNLTYTRKNSDFPSSKGRPRSLSPINEFFLTMCRLRLALREQDLANRFLISQSSVSRIVNTWINLMYYKFKEISIWPSRATIDNFMPDSFRSMYPTTRCIIDATEIFIQMPSNPSAQQLTFSNYKNHNTLKALVGITPSGAICFISKLFGGNISDKKLTLQSGLLDLLEPGDRLWPIEDLTLMNYCHLEFL